jgi:hypothetical protein
MILLTDFYVDTDPPRRGKFLKCICRNVANHSLDEVHVFPGDLGHSAPRILAAQLPAELEYRRGHPPPFGLRLAEIFLKLH